jgi:hypothetical protein
MRWGLKDLRFASQFHNASGVHDCDPVGYLRNYGKIMRDE